MAEDIQKAGIEVKISPELTNVAAFGKAIEQVIERSALQGLEKAFEAHRQTKTKAETEDAETRQKRAIERHHENTQTEMYRRAFKSSVSSQIRGASSTDDYLAFMERWAPTAERISASRRPLNQGHWSKEERMETLQAREELVGYDRMEREYYKALARIKKETGSTASGIRGMFERTFHRVGKVGSDVFKRMYTIAIRQIARQLLQLAIEGIKVEAEWDRVQGNNTSRAAETVDHLKAKWYELKKAVGAAFMPLIQIAMPVINLVINGVIALSNTVNQILRAFQGYSDYMKATYDVTKQTTGAAKELKRVLFGFDELNILPSNTGTGTTGAININDFTPTPIDSSVTEAVNRIKNWRETLANAGENAEADLEVNPYINPKVMESFDEKVRRKLKEVFHIDDADIENADRAIREGFGQAVDDLKENWENLKTNVSEALDRWKKRFNKIGTWLRQNIMIPVRQATADFYEWMLREHPKLAKFLGITQEELDTIRVEIDVLTKMDEDSDELMGSIVTSGANVALKTAINVTSSLDKGSSDLLYSPLSDKEASLATTISVGAAISDTAQQVLNASAFKAYDTHFNATIATAANLSPDTRALMASSIARAASNTFWLNFKTDTYLSPDTRKLWEVVASAGAMSASIGAQIAIRGYASGGSIANRGSLILANEAGPEVVANMGGATGIMNTSQMEAAIANGNTAVVAALYDIANEIVRTVNNKDTSVYLDGNKVGASVTKYQNNYSRSFGV